MQELVTIQINLKASKDKFNSFGKYKYRSCESILESLKPLLNSTDCHITLTDEPVIIGERYYIKATATITNNTNQSTSVCAYAREEDEKKGMDASQITGSASSYARKYALCGLFAIDDGVDSDLTNTGDEKPEKQAKKDTQQTQDVSLPLATIAEINLFNDTMIFTKSFLNQINLCTTKDELLLINKLIDDKWKKNGKVQSEAYSKAMNIRMNEIGK